NPFLSIYPNPSTDKITVELKSLNNSELLLIMDITGKIIQEIVITKAVSTIDISNFPSGIYLIKVADNNMQYFEKFVKM
ncbi:MAG TPA: T9SS type A sorting domain-containing protein, partial [Chitinophagales bacterium]|nr:T9SS type A sorting domain-containing protein [Chitinophagales bacterium]